MARAQTVLPEIVVTAPSPIVSRAPARPVTTTAPGPAPEAPAADTTPPPGTLPVVVGAFVPVTVVTPQELERSPGTTLGDVLFAKPGVTASTFAPGAASRPIIRGLDNFRVRIQENGVGSMDVSDLGEDHGVPIDPLAAQRIEVIRGPATLRWGSTAIGGVVDVTNNRIPTAAPPGGYSIVTRGAFSSVDNGHEASTVLDAGGNNLAVHADAYERRAGNYSIPRYPYLFPPNPAPPVNGKQPNSALNSQGQAVGGSYLFPDGYVGIALSHFTSLYHVPGLNSAATNTRIDLQQTKVSSRGEWRPQTSGIEAIRFWLGASDYKHDEIGLGDTGDGVQATFKNRELEGRIEVQLMPFETRFGQMTTALGVQFGHQDLGTSGEAGSLLAPAHTRSVAGYIFEEMRFTDTLKAQVAGRIESVKVNGTAATFPADFLPNGFDPVESQRDRKFTPKSVSFGLLKEVSWGVVASLTAQYVERAPRAPELFSKGAHDAPGTFEIGNPNLTIEAARTIEVGLRRAKGDFRFDATAYYTKFSNFIFKRLTGNKCGEDFASCGFGVDEEFTQIVYDQRDATFYGVELAAQLDVTKLAGGTFGVDGQYDFVHAKFADGTNVPRIPPQRLGGGLFWRDGHWFARVGLLHAFAHTDIAANETTTAGYNLLKAEMSYTTKLKPADFGAREITVGITGDNLLNDDIRNSVSFRKDDVLLPGRNVRFFASLRF